MINEKIKDKKTSIDLEHKNRNARSFDHIVDHIMDGLTQIKDAIKESGKPVMIIIDGPAGVGKSTFSKYLYEQLIERVNGDLTVSFLEQDLFGLSRTARIEMGVNPCADAARDAALFAKTDQLLEGKDIKVPKYNKLTGGRIKDIDVRHSAEVIVYEGVSALGLYYPGMQHKDQVAFRIFVQPENAEVLEESRKKRDTTERNITVQEFEREWEKSLAYSWIFTYRGRQNANITIIRQQEKTKGGDTVFNFKLVDPIQYMGAEIKLDVPMELELKKQWEDERNSALLQSPQVQVFAEASLPIVERYFSEKIPGKMEAKQALFDTINQKQGLGNVVALMGSMKKADSRNGPVFMPLSTSPQESKYNKLVLAEDRPKNTFNPTPHFAFSSEGKRQESVIFNTLEPSTDNNPEMFGLSNLLLVLSAEKEVKKFLHGKSENDINRIMEYQKKIKEFYNPSHYYKLEIGNEYIVAFQPTTPYFKGQVLFADRRDDFPGHIEEKNKSLKKGYQDFKADKGGKFYSGSPNTFFTKETRVLRRFASLSSLTKASMQKKEKRNKLWEYEDSLDFLSRRRDLTLEEAHTIQHKIIEKKNNHVKGHRSETNALLMLELLKGLNPGDILGQNSPSAITDENTTHIQCFNESQSGALPIFNAEKEQKIGEVPNGTCYQLDYPVTSFLFVLDKIDNDNIEKIKKIQDDFLEKNKDLPDSEKTEIALVARKNKDNKFEIVFMLRKDLRYHKNLVSYTAKEVLVKGENGQKPIYNKRPGFLELAGCFLQESKQAYDTFTDEKITQMLNEYSAPKHTAQLFADVVNDVTVEQEVGLSISR